MIENLQSVIGIPLCNMDLFKTALTHRSAVNESKHIDKHNERLEFLGDAVLELVVTEFLYKKYPEKPEGVLTSLRSSLVCGENLAKSAKELNLGQFLRISHGEEKFGGREKDSLLANTIESIIGAIFLDTGIENAKTFIHTYIIPYLDEIIETGSFIDAKSFFQQHAQAEFKITPHYKVISAIGPDHEKTFEVAVFVGDTEHGRGTGPSKQSAQQEASKNALDTLKIVWKTLD
ncbi:ribonuclease III [Candidatus Peregrinibacteria bacterium]|nr:MAG: ribonuclease III [Candidatus Peregrinibacteria bacterium]